MNTVAVGLSEKEAFALSLLLRKLRPEGAFVAQSLGAATQGGDLYVIDADAWVQGTALSRPRRTCAACCKAGPLCC